MTRPRVLFVSKAVAPPFHDGAACLVRDLCAGLSRCEPTVMTTNDAPPIRGDARYARIYAGRSRFSPALQDNARVFAHVMTDRAHDLWHFVFAPNPMSSRAGALLRAMRRVPIVQTVASQPRSFDRVGRLLFGDRVVALSRFTAGRLLASGVEAKRVVVVPPPLEDLTRDAAEQAEALRNSGLRDEVPTFVYPGDLEFSRGAQTVATAAALILKELPDAQIVFACRVKTPRAHQVQTELGEQLRSLGDHVRFVGEVGDLPGLLASATAVLFPVDDLYGKVDLPYAALESCLLRVPVIVADQGPLAEIAAAPRVAPGDAPALAQWAVRLANDELLRRQLGSTLRQNIASSCGPAVVASAYEELYDDLRQRGRA